MSTLGDDGFAASMLHDIGKLALDDQKQWPEHHWDLDAIGEKLDIDFSILGKQVLETIKTHHGNVERKGKFEKLYDLSALNTAQIALALADSIESSLSRQEVDHIGRLSQVVKFNPFYGPAHNFSVFEAHALLRNIVQKLSQKLDVRNLLEVQTTLLRYPHQHHYPQISLGVHHRLTAALYLVLFEELSALNSPTELRGLTIYLTEVDPQPMKLFYRLRDVVAYSKIANTISGKLYGEYFRKYTDTVDFDQKYNPFTFYYGDGMIFFSGERLTDPLHNILQTIQGVDSLDIKTLELTFPFDWKGEDHVHRIYVNSKLTRYKITEESVVSNRVLKYSEKTLDHCAKCGIPIPEELPEKVCDSCRMLKDRFSSGIDIDTICRGDDGVSKIAYVFLNLPTLSDHARKVADEVLIDRFVREERLPLGSIQSTQYGFLEYLQALQEIEDFQEEITNTTERMRREQKNEVSHTLFRVPEKLCIVLREDFLWEFLDYLNTRRHDLQLNSSATIFITKKKTPFWSLMNQASEYAEGDILYDVTRGEIIMFSARETQSIRELAAEANRRGLPQYQLNRLSKFALRTNEPELMLEIDRSADRLRGLEHSLKQKLGDLEYEGTELQRAEKRSIFLKYVADLIKVQRGKRRR